MYKRLLIPLDGSRLAESVLPAAAFLATHLHASVVLIHVIEHGGPSEVHGERHLRTEPEAEEYLRGISSKSFSPDVRVETHVHTEHIESVTQSIVQHVTEYSSDLILMCAHGRSGAKQFLFGAIAQQVLSLGAVSVILFRAPTEPTQRSFVLNDLLLPLDGQPTHEHSIPVARSLAKQAGAAIHLLRVVPTYGHLSGAWIPTSRLLPSTTTRMLDIAVQEAQDYLDGLKSALADDQITVTTEVSRGEPSNVVAEIAENRRSDLIVVGTHGKVGTDAFWSGSVAPKICRACTTPVLLVPAAISH